MSEVAALIADMVRAGVDPELIGRTAAALSEREPVIIPDEAAERRRGKDRERKRLRNSAKLGGVVAPSPDKETPPTPPKETNPNLLPPSPPKGGSSPADFAEFWETFPNKVGKGAAQRSFKLARRKVDQPTLMAALRAYRSKTDDRPWCNPATWLNQERWADQPASARLGPTRSTPPGWPSNMPEPEVAFRTWKQGHWPSNWGFPPGDPGCAVPDEILVDWQSPQRGV